MLVENDSSNFANDVCDDYEDALSDYLHIN